MSSLATAPQSAGLLTSQAHPMVVLRKLSDTSAVEQFSPYGALHVAMLRCAMLEIKVIFSVDIRTAPNPGEEHTRSRSSRRRVGHDGAFCRSSSAFYQYLDPTRGSAGRVSELSSASQLAHGSNRDGRIELGRRTLRLQYRYSDIDELHHYCGSSSCMAGQWTGMQKIRRTDGNEINKIPLEVQLEFEDD
jgi:hypothetical protein